MPNPIYALPLLTMLLAAPAAVPASTAPARQVEWNQAVAMLQHITIHVPRVSITRSTTIITRSPAPEARAARAAPPPPLAYREKKADDCLKMKKVVGFAVNTRDAIDLVLDDGKLIRARLGSNCPSLGFYSGFYVKPNPDGKICAKRDALRSRMGKACAVDQFNRLVPVK
jgi:hypothetical protein